MMMHDDLESKMKEKLLEGLIDHMQDKMGEGMESKYPKKAMEVSVAAPDKDHLIEGLDKAKHLAAGDITPVQSDDDEDRLMDLMGQDDDEDDEDKHMMG